MKSYDNFPLMRAAVTVCQRWPDTKPEIIEALRQELKTAREDQESSLLIAALTDAIKDIE